MPENSSKKSKRIIHHFFWMVILFLTLSGEKEIEWKEFHVPEGGYSLLMLGPPKRTEEFSKNGFRVVSYESLDQHHDFATVVAADLLAGATIYRDEAATRKREIEMLEGGRKRLLTGDNFTLVQEKEITDQKFPGKEIVFKERKSKNDPENIMVMRVYAKEDKLIQLMVQMISGDPLSDPEVLRFLNSFRMDEPAESTPATEN